MKLGSTDANTWEISENVIDLARGPRAPVRMAIAARGKSVVIDRAATAMIVIDMQNFFCHPDARRGAGKPGVDRTDSPATAAGGDDSLPAARPIAPLMQLLPRLRQWQVPIIWLNWGNRRDKLNLAPNHLRPFHRQGGMRPPLIDRGSWDAEVVAPLVVDDDDIRVDKYRISGFWDTPLDSILRNLRVQTLLFAGVNLDQCVYATLLDASCLGYDCILVEDCAATSSPDFCAQGALYNIERGLGFVTDSAAVLAARSEP